jgi:alcohol dehydrogenase class IV
MENVETSMLMAHDWDFPVPIAYGPGRLAEIGQRCLSMGLRNPLVVTDRGSRDLPFLTQTSQSLSEAGLASGIFSEISPNPRDNEIGKGVEAYRTHGHDGIIAIGGGSAMDGAKAIGLTAGNELDLWAFEFEQPVPEVKSDFPTLITVPTTAGTGAETEGTAMVTHSAKGMKFCIWHPGLKPSLALLDPELTVGLPSDLTAWTGADALIHAVEAYMVPGFHPLCDAVALEALSLITKWLPVAVSDPANLAARGGMLTGSCLAGIAFLKGLGMVHAISHMVGAEYNTHHGLTNAIVLPVVLRFNLEGQDEKVKRMADAMSLGDSTVEGFISDINAMLDQIGIPTSLSAIGVPADASSRLAEKAIQDSAAATNPRTATVEEIRTLIEQAIEKAR